MKISKQQLQQLITEELQKVFKEEGDLDEGFFDAFKKDKKTPLGKQRDNIQIALDVVQTLATAAREREPQLIDAFRKVIIKLQAELNRASPQGSSAMKEIAQDNE